MGAHTDTVLGLWAREPRHVGHQSWTASTTCLSYMQLCSKLIQWLQTRFVSVILVLWLQNYHQKKPGEAVRKRGQWGLGVANGRQKKRGRERTIRIKVKVLLLRKLGALPWVSDLLVWGAEMEPTGLCVQGDRRWERSLGWPEKGGQRISQEAPCSHSQDARQVARGTISFCCRFLRWLKHGISEGQLC